MKRTLLIVAFFVFDLASTASAQGRTDCPPRAPKGRCVEQQPQPEYGRIPQTTDFGQLAEPVLLCGEPPENRLTIWEEFARYAGTAGISIGQPMSADQSARGFHLSYGRGIQQLRMSNELYVKLYDYMFAKGLNPILPLTGTGSINTAVMKAENDYGRDAGKWGPQTHRTACITAQVMFRFEIDEVSETEIDLGFLGDALRRASRTVENDLGRIVLDEAGDTMRNDQIYRKNEMLSGRLYLQFFSNSTRELLFSKISEREVTIPAQRLYDILFVRKASFSEAGDAELLTALVEGLDDPAPLSQEEQDLEDEIANNEREAARLERLEELEERKRESEERLAKARRN